MTTLKARVNGEWVPISTGSGGGTGADEVWVGPDTPPSAEAELWYDTDDEPAAVDAANYWNTAWGRVAYVPLVDVTAPSSTTHTFPAMSVTLVAGRNYRFTFFMRAYAATGGVIAGLNTKLMVDGVQNGSDPWMATAGQWDNGTVTFLRSCPGNITAGAHTVAFQVLIPSNVGITFWGDDSYFLCEDVGPVTRASVNPPAGQPTIATAGNALGIVAVGSFIATGAPWGLPQDVQTKVAALNFTTVVGRRYRLTLVVRAKTVGTVGQAAVNVLWYGSGVPATDSWSHLGSAGYYSDINQQVVFDGTGVASAYEVALRPLFDRCDVWTNLGSTFYLEDVGPNSAPALPIPETPPAWTPLTPLNGWTVLSSYVTPGYRKIGDIVTLRGVVVGSSATSATIASLPVGFRPGGRELIPNIYNDTPTPSYVDLRTNGDIIVSSTPRVWTTLSGIQFSVTP